MQQPDWAHLNVDPIHFQEISYFSAPKSDKDRPQSLDEVDPKLLETYDKLVVPLHECRSARPSARSSRRPA